MASPQSDDREFDEVVLRPDSDGVWQRSLGRSSRGIATITGKFDLDDYGCRAPMTGSGEIAKRARSKSDELYLAPHFDVEDLGPGLLEHIENVTPTITSTWHRPSTGIG